MEQKKCAFVGARNPIRTLTDCILRKTWGLNLGYVFEDVRGSYLKTLRATTTGTPNRCVIWICFLRLLRQPPATRLRFYGRNRQNKKVRNVSLETTGYDMYQSNCAPPPPPLRVKPL